MLFVGAGDVFRGAGYRQRHAGAPIRGACHPGANRPASSPAASSPLISRICSTPRPGSLIVVDNVVRDGAVIDGRSRDAAVQGVRRLYELIAAEPRVAATAVQTVGVKGYDGFAIALVVA